MSLLSENARNTATCPFCKEFINRSAVRCPHCHADLKPPRPTKRSNSFSNGFFIGVFITSLFWLAVLLLYLRYMY